MSRKTWIWLTVASAVVLVLLIGGAIVAVMNVSSTSGGGVATRWEEHVVKEGGTDRILLLNVDGMIMSSITGTTLGAAGTSSDEMRAKLDQAMKDKTLKGIVVHVNSPGGDVVASDEIYRKLVQVKEDTGLPLVFSFGSTAASGGYYIAAAADQIVSNPMTITGSIGVIMSSYNYSELADKAGVREVIIKSGEMKDMGSGMRDMTDEERDIFQTVVDESYGRFVEVVSTGRGMSEDRVRDLADGRIYTGQQAKELGLVDQLGTLEDAIQTAEELAGVTDATVVSYSEPFNLSSLFRMTAEQLAGRKPLSVAELLEVNPPGLMYLYTTD